MSDPHAGDSTVEKEMATIGTLSDDNWTDLLSRIQSGRCTPFLGSGVNEGILPTGADLAKELAARERYPFGDFTNLQNVSQYLAVMHDPMYPKEQTVALLREKLAAWKTPEEQERFFSTREAPLSILAALPFPVYITTNYDDLMIRALLAQKTPKKTPKRELCHWNKYIDTTDYIKRNPSVFKSRRGFAPGQETPVVFHLHGHDEVPESLVLTEDCYCDFVANISRRKDAIPLRIQQALAGSSLLFIGYRLADFDFHVIYKGVVGQLEGSLRRGSVSVQIPREGSETMSQKRLDYFVARFRPMKVSIFWGTAKEFARELWRRWQESQTPQNQQDHPEPARP
jgi:hypothetical protein